MAGASVAIDFDEFGSLDLITLPGQKVAEVIRLVVLMYVRFPLSLRNVEDLLFE